MSKFNFDAYPEVARRRADYEAMMRLPKDDPARVEYDRMNPLSCGEVGKKYTIDVTVTDPFLFSLCIIAMFNDSYPGVPGADMNVVSWNRDRTAIRDYLRAELARVEAELNGQSPTR